jgi:hypothetical protein
LGGLGHLWEHHRNVHGVHKFSEVRCGAERNQALLHWAQVLCRDLADLPFRHIGRRKVYAFSFSNPPSVYEFILPKKQAPPFPAPFRLGSLESSASHPFDISLRALGNEFGLETEIAAARQRKDEAKHAILKYVSERGC